MAAARKNPGRYYLPCRIKAKKVPAVGFRCRLALAEWDKHQVLAGGWGKLERNHVSILLPRDEQEPGVFWSILSRAYGYLSCTSAKDPKVDKELSRESPRYFGTNLQ